MRILLIEDEQHFAEPLCASLKKAGYATDWIANGIDGLQQAYTDIYDVIILDWMLPEMSGIDVLRTLRSQNIHTKVLLLTAKSTLEDKVTGLDCGADDYLCKPFHREELFARLRALARRQNAPANDRLCFGDLYMENGLNILYCETSGLNISLNGKEYQMMDYLLRNVNQITGREQMIEKIWGYDSEAEYNNVEVYISFLRKKLSYLKTRVTIKTVRKLGYILNDPDK